MMFRLRNPGCRGNQIYPAMRRRVIKCLCILLVMFEARSWIESDVFRRGDCKHIMLNSSKFYGLVFFIPNADNVFEYLISCPYI
jgi:hypothetical protein